MDLYEYQGKELFREAGLPVPPGEVATTPEEAEVVARELGVPVVVKAQVRAGGRGKAGGVKVTEDPATAKQAASEILGMHIKGEQVRRVLVTRAEEIAQELYAAITLDRARGRMLLVVSGEGGVDIEEVAAERPDAILREVVDSAYGLMPFQARRVAAQVVRRREVVQGVVQVLLALDRMVQARDTTLAEINPLAITPSGAVWALDAKVTLDDNALFRQEVSRWQEEQDQDATEVEARERGLAYVKMGGTVGCMVNGAGLAMATMDLIKFHGGEPANFLDIGGSSSPEKVIHAMEIILQDPRVRVILINIFGGITRCDDVAKGMVEAIGRLGPRVPIVVRLTGTNEAEAMAILEENGISAGPSMEEAVRRAVEKAWPAAVERSS